MISLALENQPVSQIPWTNFADSSDVPMAEMSNPLVGSTLGPSRTANTMQNSCSMDAHPPKTPQTVSDCACGSYGIRGRRTVAGAGRRTLPSSTMALSGHCENMRKRWPAWVDMRQGFRKSCFVKLWAMVILYLAHDDHFA